MVNMIDMVKKNPYKGEKKSWKFMKRIIFITIVLSCVSATLYNHRLGTGIGQHQSHHNMPNGVGIEKLTTVIKKCEDYSQSEAAATTATIDPNTIPEEKWSKPIWFKFLHHSFPDEAHKNLINNLTNLNAGGKNFYVSASNLKHCKGTTQTVTCATGENVISPRFKGVFHDKYIMIIRNPMSAMPSTANHKDIKYHNLIGQMKIDNWRNTRDVWIDKMMNDWVEQIVDWRKNEDYDAGLYVVYEDLMDAVRGPSVVREIAKVIQGAGFDTVAIGDGDKNNDNDDDIPCIWLNSLGQDSLELYQKNQYDFDGYIPGFTKEQQGLMLSKLDALMKEVGEGEKDSKLMDTLKRYYDEVRDNIVIDVKWSNQTEAKVA